MSDTVLITLDNLEPKNFFHFMLLMDLKEKKEKEKKKATNYLKNWVALAINNI